MRKLLLIGVALFGLVIGGHAQTPPAAECPTISVTAPAGVIQPPDPIWFIAEITGTVPKDIRYHWTVTKGSITHGQGTSKIETQPENEKELNITATVAIDGLPEACYDVASESYVLVKDNFDSILMFEVSSSNLDADLELCAIANVLPRYHAIVTELEQNTTNQAYIIFSHRSSTSPDEAEACERGVIRFFTNAGIDRSRITSRRRTSEQVSVQFWRVPPGRENPTCEECEEPERVKCPTISVTGPAGITQPGDPMTFSANIAGSVPRGVSYFWTVSEGEILEGQGTLNLKVKTPNRSSFNITATLEIGSLPDGCPNTVSETAPVTCSCSPILVDEFSASPYVIDKVRLDRFVEELRKNPSARGYIIEYFRHTTPESVVDKKVKEITEYLIRTKQLEKAEFDIVVSHFDENRTKFYAVPPGAEFPVP